MVKISVQPPIIHRFVYELRYDYGFTYLDRCGATINDILKKNPGWVHISASPKTTTIRNQEKNITFNFSVSKLDLVKSRSEKVATLMSVEEFAKIACSLTDEVVNRLGIEDFTRVGFRLWRLFGNESIEAAKEAVKNLGFVSFEKLKDVGLDNLNEVNCTLLLDHDGISSRIAIAPVEQNIEFDPATIKQASGIPHKLHIDQHRALIAKLKAKSKLNNIHYMQFLSI